MSTATKPIWRTATGREEDDFDAIWLYENTWEWTFSEENGIVTLHYLSSKVMPTPRNAKPELEEEWQATLKVMSHKDFVDLMTWVWSDTQ